MINRVRDLILNLPPSSDLESLEAERINENFVPVEFPPEMQRVHKVLFEGVVSAPDRGLRALQLLQLTQSTELETYLRSLDTVNLVDTNSARYFRDPRPFNLVTLDQRLRGMTSDLSAVESLAVLHLEPEVVKTLRYLSRSHTSPIYRVGALVTLFVLLAEVLNAKRGLSG